MAWFSSKIEVTLIDDATGEPLGVTRMPPDQLPESFEIDTTLHLGDDDWSVVDAQPKTRAEYVRFKTLVLRLRRIEMIDPSKVQFSYATICDRLPALGAPPADRDTSDYMLHEDDWAQIEFVALTDREHVTAQVAKIRQSKIDNWTGHGWSEIVVRPDHPTPLISLQIKFDALKEALPGLAPGRVFIFQSYGNPTGTAREVQGGFAFPIHSGTTIFGHQEDGIVASLAADTYFEDNADVDPVSRHISAIGRLGSLLLVDWHTDHIVTLGDKDEIDQWLNTLADPG